MDTYEELKGKRKIGRVEYSHGTDIGQFSVYVRHSSSKAAHNPLYDVEVRKEQKVSPVSDLSHFVSVFMLVFN